MGIIIARPPEIEKRRFTYELQQQKEESNITGETLRTLAIVLSMSQSHNTSETELRMRTNGQEQIFSTFVMQKNTQILEVECEKISVPLKVLPARVT